MKKMLFSLLILLLFPLVVLARDPKVLTLDAESEDSQISFSGTIEDGSHAVMCKLLDSDNKIADTLSVAVSEGDFVGELTAPKTGDYTVSCANYEGGEIKAVSVSAQVKETTSGEIPKTPSTLDNVFKYLSLLIISILGLSFITFKNLKKEN